MNEGGNSSADAGLASEAGRRISHYEIREKLGEGGMGVVYRAEDTRLGRSVALKFIKAHHSQRWEREARAIAALNHPHIATLYDVGEDRGSLYLAMEFVKGAPLAGPLPANEVIQYGIQVADALASAHAAGIVHRDLKPANILVTENGAVKILDFGLAKLTEQDATGSVASTQTVSISGTPGYMAPEQLEGQPADARSDIFAFACVLYELLTGRRAFPGRNFAAALTATAMAQPAPLEGAPEAVVHLVRRMMEKDPARRPQTMEEVLGSLRACLIAPGEMVAVGKSRRWRRPGRRLILATAATALALLAGSQLWRLSRAGGVPKEKKIAVLPFRNVGDQAANQAFCDGVMETVASSLTQMEQFHGALWVVPASEVRREGVSNPHDAARALGVNLAIGGSVQREGDNVRLITNLVNAGTLQQLRSRQVSRGRDDLSELQDWVIQASADMLDLELRPQARQALAGGSTTASGAYDLYLQAEGHLQRRARGDLELAIGLFRRAISQDPSYALAHDGLAEAYWLMYRATKDTQWVEPARENSRRALALSDRLPSAYRTLGMIESGSGRHDAALQAFQRSLALDPASAVTYNELGAAYEAMGKPEDAEKSYLKATELHPGDWSSLNYLALYYYRQGRYRDAVPLLTRGLELAPDNNSLYTNLGATHWMAGQLEEAGSSFQRSLALRPSSSAYTNLGTVYFYQGRCREAAPLMEKAVDLQPKNNEIWANLADVYTCVGSADKAATAYGRAIGLVQDRLSVNPGDPEALGALGLYRARLGDRGQALPITAKAQSLGPANRSVRWHAALAYELCGRREEALQALAAAVRLGQPLNEVRNEPALAALRTDARYQRLIAEQPAR